MSKPDKFLLKFNGDLYECTVLNFKQKKKPSLLGRVYGVVRTTEKIAVSLSHLNRLRKKCEKARLKRLKKYGTVDKKTGILTYAKLPTLKPATRLKRYTVDFLSKNK